MSTENCDYLMLLFQDNQKLTIFSCPFSLEHELNLPTDSVHKLSENR